MLLILFRRIVEQINPKFIFFVGCAALLDERKEPQENMVFVANSAIDTDKREISPEEVTYSMQQHHGDQSILRNIQTLADDNQFDGISLITNRYFLSGSAFAKDKNSEFRKDLLRKFPPDAVVIEMEAFSIFKEVFNRRADGNFDGYVSVIKGISDLGDEDAQHNKEETQKHAASNATKVVCKLLSALPIGTL